MYFNLIGALRRRLILELQDSFSRHPVYRKIVPFIQNKYSFEERPQFGIVLKGASGNKVQLSSDNFLGVLQSHVMLAYVGQPKFPLEWIREDLALVRAQGHMPTLPGVYFLEVLSAPTTPGELGYYALDPLLTVFDELLIRFQTGIETEAQLQQLPAADTLRLYENNRFLLTEGEHYSVDYSNGAIHFLAPFGKNAKVTADYRYAAPSIGPIPFQWNTADTKTLPGVVLAFGNRAEAGDKVCVVVYPERVDAAEAYGGKFEVTFDMDVIARDPAQMEQISDLCFEYLIAVKKPILEFEGIEIIDVSQGGEAEELYDETGDEYFFQSSVSVQLRADWELHVPLPLTVSRVSQTLVPVHNSIYFEAHSVLVGRNNDYERIS